MGNENFTYNKGMDVSSIKKGSKEANAKLRSLGAELKYVAVSSQDYNSRIVLLNKVIEENVKKEELLKEKYNELKEARDKDIVAISNDIPIHSSDVSV